jgi:hypothetical protein
VRPEHGYLCTAVFLVTFFVLCGTGPIVRGYTLIVSKDHVPCFGDIPITWYDEFYSIHQRLASALQQTYGHWPAMYEHGRSGACLGLREHTDLLCEHCHINVVPSSIDLTDRFHPSFRTFSVTGITDLGTFYRRYGVYLFYQYGSRATVLIPESGNIPSSYFRRLYGEALDNPNLWNWMDNPQWEIVRSTFHELKAVLT